MIAHVYGESGRDGHASHREFRTSEAVAALTGRNCNAVSPKGGVILTRETPGIHGFIVGEVYISANRHIAAGVPEQAVDRADTAARQFEP